jgi:hypothetical protein
MTTVPKIGDRYFNLSVGSNFTYFTLKHYDVILDLWRIKLFGNVNDIAANDSFIYPEEIERLQWFGHNLIKVEDDRHLLALQMRY